VSLGRWGGIHVRLHALFILFGVLGVFVCSRDPNPYMGWYGALSLLVLFASVLLHELAHCYAAMRMGGHAEEVILGPFGGLAHVRVPREPHRELVAALAGPAMNLGLWMVAALLLFWAGGADLVGLLHPLRPAALLEGPLPVVFLKLTYWLNWIVVLVNLLPASMFDGGRALRAILWPTFGYREAVKQVSRVATFAAILLCLLAWAIHDPQATAPIPVWLPLVLIALFLFLNAKQEVARSQQGDTSDDSLGYDFSQGYTSLERDSDSARDNEPGFMRRWLEKRREEKERQLREQELAEESRVDEILARLHGTGMEGLSAEERALLERVSARYRNRMKH
jgi:Zn-dependent protease